MALPPTIPTSFVPYSASTATRRFRSDFTGAFGFFAYGVFFIVVALAVGVFLYGRILNAEQASKDAALTKAVAAIDPATIESFIRLRDRLNSGKTLLAGHNSFSAFFASLETLMPATVRLSSLHIAQVSTGGVTLSGAGIAKSFNALAAVSDAFAKDGRIKDAIFSNIVVNKGGAVSFSLAATLDSKVLLFNPMAPTASAPAAPPASSGSAATTSAATTTSP